jgi:membrane protein DedA with SNARE-associated domain
MIIIFTLGSVLNPALVGLVAGTGLTSGGLILYTTGRGGRRFFPRISVSDPADEAYSNRMVRFLRHIKVGKLLHLAHRRGVLAIFIASMLPNPLFTPLATSMGTIRFRFVKFFFACWAGQTIKATVIAYFGYLGLGSFLRWLELIPRI